MQQQQNRRDVKRPETGRSEEDKTDVRRRISVRNVNVRIDSVHERTEKRGSGISNSEASRSVHVRGMLIYGAVGR